ncbi:hypothetical protein HKD37_03G006598 [Glycine soja]
MLLRIIPPSEPKFIAQPGLPNEEYGPFSEDEDEILNTSITWIANKSNIKWRLSLKRASYILASKQCEMRKLHKPHTCSNPSISQDHAKLSYLLISKSIHNLIKNDPSTLLSTLITHIKSTEGYTTTYRKAWMTKKKAIEDNYDNLEKSYHDIPGFFFKKNKHIFFKKTKGKKN